MSLPRLRLSALVAVVLAVSASAQSVSTFALDDVPNWQEDSAMSLAITAPLGGLGLSFFVVPFTANAGLNVSDSQRGNVSLRGKMVIASESTYAGIKSPDAIAYLCCDAKNNSFITPDMMINKLMENNPKAILLYSLQGNCCGVSGLTNSSNYQSIFTMMDINDSESALNNTKMANGVLLAAITGNLTSPDSENAAGATGNNSAVAMSVLYSITGLITLLFLVIIATGAIRAHRYPERYGPRSGYGGRPRQSRAKGIARAVLDTLPIVKFGAPPQQQGKPDPALELEEGTAADQTTKTSTDRAQAHHLSTIPEDAEAVPSGNNAPTRESRVPPATSEGPAAALVASQEPVGDEHLGCSICTEDFLVGEDVRVLPCDHKFHPPCIDPWLINVSGTCPLCRLDLHPHKSTEDDDSTHEATELPPPLEAEPEQEGGSRTRRESRRSSRFFDLHRLRHASVEERIEVLRRYRTESRETENADEEQGRRSRLTSRLRERFRIRTRAQSPAGRRAGTGVAGAGAVQLR